ncbi:phosphodiester glycosidase family protein [Chryseobacterium zhengzhouense]|uniref:Phosphodiester glycosidase family protein n=1 Tax=Chryseobacterium zhengzhouense TaxID=1636086 RepID=A0ABW2M5L0_9FLAO
MKKHFQKLLICSILILFFSCKKEEQINPDFVIYYTKSEDKVELFWKNDKNETLKTLKNLKEFVESKKQTLKFAMNGGMFIQNNIPKGLFIENYQTLNPIDTLSGKGNFHLKPNGVFSITKSGNYEVLPTKYFKSNSETKFATQSGPILIFNGKINSIFQKNSKNLNIRNGIGILKNGEAVFVMSKKKINFYDFAGLFKNLGCENALYLDGFVSRAYLPEQNWIQEDGDFGVMIGVISNNK